LVLAHGRLVDVERALQQNLVVGLPADHRHVRAHLWPVARERHGLEVRRLVEEDKRDVVDAVLFVFRMHFERLNPPLLGFIAVVLLLPPARVPRADDDPVRTVYPLVDAVRGCHHDVWRDERTAAPARKIHHPRIFSLRRVVAVVDLVDELASLLERVALLLEVAAPLLEGVASLLERVAPLLAASRRRGPGGRDGARDRREDEFEMHCRQRRAASGRISGGGSW